MADNELGNLIWIEHYGKAKYKNADAKPTKWTNKGKYSAKHSTTKYVYYDTYKAKITKVVDGKTVNTSCDKVYKRMILWKKEKLSGNKQSYRLWNQEKYAQGFLTTTTFDNSIRYQNVYVCDSATDVNAIKQYNGGKRFPTPSALDFSFMDINVEKDDETKKKSVISDVGRGETGYLTLNRVRDNVVKIEAEWYFLTASETSNLLKVLSYSTSPWLRIQFHNPYSNAVETKWFYVGDRSITKSHNNVYTNLKVSFIEK